MTRYFSSVVEAWPIVLVGAVVANFTSAPAIIDVSRGHLLDERSRRYLNELSVLL